MTNDAPNIAIAGDLAAAAVGHSPINVRRFGTGPHHYVFDATFADRPPVVVRIAAKHSRPVMAGALRLSSILRPRGVPLPEIIAEGVNHRFSHLVMERLPGTDLGEVLCRLSDKNLDYAIEPAQAPRERWSQVLLDNLARSRRRIAAAKLFDEDAIDTIVNMVSAAHAELDALSPVPFLHDTTTKNVIVTQKDHYRVS
jgi:hypothetical protein